MKRKAARPIILLGPTAVGKTAISLSIAEQWGGEVIVADALQVYKYMDIGTAKPSAKERERIPHHLLDIVEPSQPFTAGDFSRLAKVKIREIQQRGRLPLVVGGCGLYIRALADGLFAGAPEVPEIRERLRREAREKGGEALHQRLFSLDPVSAHKVNPHDTFRVIRALEILEACGKKPSEIRGEPWARRQKGDFLFIGLSRPRASLYRLIEARIEAMIEAGFLAEVQSLLARYSPDCKPFQGLGYKHMIDYLQQRCDFEQMAFLWKRDTRRYVKRQLTWFSKDDRIIWVSLEGGEEEACRRIQDLIKTRIS